MFKTILFTVFFVALLSAAPAARGGVNFHSDPQAEAELLAVEVSGELKAPVLLAAQIKADLASIRANRPDWSDARVFPVWAPGEILVKLTPAGFADHENGVYSGFAPLFEELGAPSIRTLIASQQTLLIDFNRVYHDDRLSEEFSVLDEVVYAEPNYLLGDGNDIIAYPGRKYVFKRGWGDCPAGCILEETEFFDLGGADPLSIPGDYNADGSIDAADYTVWRDHVGDPAGTLPNDVNGIAIGPAQYATWAANYEIILGSSAAAPEPLTAGLLLCGAACLAIGKSPRAR